MKRIALFLLTASLLSSCVGTASLWGQYPTPTPLGGAPVLSLPIAEPLVTQTPPPVIPTELPATITPTALFSAFVTQPPTSTSFNFSSPTAAENTVLYYSQSGDWLPAVASRFGVAVTEITSPKPISQSGFLDIGTLLIIPDRRDYTAQYTPPLQILPDSEIVFSPSAVDFDVAGYIASAGGYLSTHREYLGSTGWMTGAAALERSAYENSINPRVLLAILDYEAQWVRGTPQSQFRKDYPLGYENFRNKGMFLQLAWGTNQLSTGYYGWRAGMISEITFLTGETYKLDPSLNAGTVAVMYYFSRGHSLNEWLRIMDQSSGFSAFYANMFGDPWSRADSFGVLFPPNLLQPEMVLPIEPGQEWAVTGGPHAAWGKREEVPLAALDFAPSTDKSGCVPSTKWVLASMAGLVVRSDRGVVMVDGDGDGHEQTGWNIMYLHIANKDRVPLGTWVNRDDRIGHPSCEGGISNGTHTHVARKFNGEWMIADGPIPWVLSGWTVIAGEKPYLGKLVKGNRVVVADEYGQAKSLIVREEDE